MQRRRSERREPPRTKRDNILNYRKRPRGPCRNSMKCVTYKNVIRTSPGGAYAHKRTYDGEIEAPTLVPSHRHVKNGVRTGKITRCVGNPKPAPKGKNVRTSARLTRKVASKHRRAAQPHIVQLSRRKRKVRKRVTPELPCHAWLTTGDRNIAKWKAALKCLQWRHCRWRPPRRRGHRRCATRRSRA